MSGEGPRYVHATALVLGERGILIRGPSGAGKSRLARLLIAEAGRRRCFGRLVGDDRVALERRHGRVLVRGHPDVAGLLECRHEGVITVPFEAVCVVGRVLDLSPEPLDRLPDDGESRTELLGVVLPRLRLPAGLHGVDCGLLLDSRLVLPPT